MAHLVSLREDKAIRNVECPSFLVCFPVLIARQQVQRGVVRQGKAKRLRVVGIAMNRCQLGVHARLRRDARDR